MSVVIKPLALVVFLLPAPAFSATMPLLGDYLDTAYISALERTRSPLAAAMQDSRQNVPQLISVQAQGLGRRFAASYDWRAGAFLFVLQRDGRVRREMAWGPGPQAALRLVDTENFCLAMQQGGEHCYQHMPHLARFVAGAVLAGRYLDRQGAAYRFTAGGHAYFPGYDFAYAPVLEKTGGGYDLFTIGNEGRFMAFVRSGKLVTLYAVDTKNGASAGTPDMAHKLAVLRQLPEARQIASR